MHAHEKTTEQRRGGARCRRKGVSVPHAAEIFYVIVCVYVFALYSAALSDHY